MEPLAKKSQLNFTFSVGGEYQDETDIQGGGDVSVWRAASQLGVRSQLSPDLSVSFQVGMGIASYDFDGDRGLPALEPWGDIYVVASGARLQYELSNDWAIFGGPIFMIAREDSFDHSDAWVGGGIIGATYAVSPDFRLGLGIGVISQIEDDAKVFPNILIDWEFTNRLKLTNASRPTTGPGAGLELVYDVGQGLELGLGGSYEFLRFRLDDEGVAPDGVGQEERFLGYGRLSWQVYPRVRLDFFAGAVLDGTLRLENDNGNKVREEDYDSPSGFVGLYATIRF
jgi:hypothetical protein